MKKLDETGRGNPFRIPEGYFDEVNRKIISAVPEYSAGPGKPSLFIRLKPVLKLAAFITGFILAGYFILRTMVPAADQSLDQEISEYEFSGAYLNDIELAIKDEEGIALLIPEGIPDVSDSDIVEYLIMENVKTDEIYENL